MNIGDEIGVFSSNGKLCGAKVYQGTNLAITIWGDDISTADSIESLIEGDSFMIKVWYAAFSEESTITFELENNVPLYQTNGFYILDEISTPGNVSRDSGPFGLLHLLS